MVLDCSEGGAGRGVGRGFGFGTGIAFAPVAGIFLGGGVAGGGCTFVGAGVFAFGPAVGFLPLSLLVGPCFGEGGVEVEVAAST